MSEAVVDIGRRRVGDQQPVLVVAEAGVNHNGSVEQALRLVDVAVTAGADMVKFQVFRAAELVTADAGVAAYQQAAGQSSQRAMLERLELSDRGLARVASHCRERGIAFLATPFSPADVDRLEKLGVPAIKIASTDINNVPLLHRAAHTGLPLIVSTGASTPDEIAAAVRRLRDWGAGRRLILLHCVSGYPVPLDAANLRAIAALRQAFGVPCGFSDHSESVDIAGWAVAAGACLLEKHFTLDRSAPGPDHAMSLDPVQLTEYVRTARQAEAALGTGRLGMSSIETEVRAVARRSIVAATTIPVGTVITPEMLSTKRPAGGIAPDQLEAVVGRVAGVDIAVDTVVKWEMLR